MAFAAPGFKSAVATAFVPVAGWVDGRGVRRSAVRADPFETEYGPAAGLRQCVVVAPVAGFGVCLFTGHA